MITLSVPVAIPNIARLRVERDPQDAGTEYVVTVRAQNLANTRAVSYDLVVRNGACDQLRVNPLSKSFDDTLYVARDAFTNATGADQIEAAKRSGATKAAMLRAVETAMQAVGCFEAALAGAVS